MLSASISSGTMSRDGSTTFREGRSTSSPCAMKVPRAHFFYRPNVRATSTRASGSGSRSARHAKPSCALKRLCRLRCPSIVPPPQGSRPTERTTPARQRLLYPPSSSPILATLLRASDRPVGRAQLGGEPVNWACASIGELERVDLAAAWSEGALRIDTSDEPFLIRIGGVLDGEVRHSVRSGGTNPLVITITFPEPIRVKVARAFLAASPNDWTFRPHPSHRFCWRLASRPPPGPTSLCPKPSPHGRCASRSCDCSATTSCT